jgi:hypothetical protein
MNNGGDYLRVAIYRNFVKGTPLNHSTLVGQSVQVLGSTGIPYTRSPIVAISGQNLNFTTGEYIVIGFSSSGITNTYLGSVISTANSDIAFISSTNYVLSGFPTTITTSTQNNTLTNKVCMTFY